MEGWVCIAVKYNLVMFSSNISITRVIRSLFIMEIYLAYIFTIVYFIIIHTDYWYYYGI